MKRENTINNTKNKVSLLRDFDKVSKHVHKALENKMDSSQISQIIEESRDEYERIIHELPYIGGKKNPFQFNLIGSAWMLALYRTLESQGYGTRKIGEMGYDVMEQYVNSISPLYKSFFRRFVYSRFMKRKMKNDARKSQLREFPDDWVFEFVEGIRGEFNWGADVTECGICKFFKAQNAEKFLPYLCIADFAQFNQMGIGMKRTKTIGTGQSHCDFRYVKGYVTPRGWPPETLDEFQQYQEFSTD